MDSEKHYRIRVTAGKGKETELTNRLIEDPLIHTWVGIETKGFWDTIKACFDVCRDVIRGELVYHIRVSAEDRETTALIMNPHYQCDFCVNRLDEGLEFGFTWMFQGVRGFSVLGDLKRHQERHHADELNETKARVAEMRLNNHVATVAENDQPA